GVEDDGATLNPLAGNLTLTDNVGIVRSRNSYFTTAGGTPTPQGRQVLSDDAQDRVRLDYGFNAAGGTNDAGGNFQMTDNNGNERLVSNYLGATSNIIMRDNAAADRFVTSVTNANIGGVTVNEGGGNQRFVADYNAAVGQLAMSGPGGAQRFVTDYDAANTSSRIVTPGTAQIRAEMALDGAIGARLRIADGAANDRWRAEQNATDTNVRTFDSNGDLREEFTSVGGQAFKNRLDTDGVVRYQFEMNPGIERIQGNDGAGVPAAFDRRIYSSTTGVQTWHDGVGTQQVFIQGNTGNAAFAGTNSTGLTALDQSGSGGAIFLSPSTGDIDIASGDDANSALDFKGSGNLGSNYQGRIGFNDPASEFMFDTSAGAQDPEMVIRDGLVVLAGSSATEGGQITYSSDNTNPRGQVANSWTTDAFNDRFRIFRGTLGAGAQALQARVVGGNARVKIGQEQALGGIGFFSASPLGADRSTIDVDDIYLRGRDVWLSTTNARDQLVVVGVEVLSDGDTVTSTVIDRCLSAPGGGGTIFYAATPAWWISPVMIAQTQISQAQFGDGGVVGADDVVQVSAVNDINPGNGNPITGANYDNKTEGRVFMTGGGTLVMEARQQNDPTWRQMNNGVAVVTVLCDL
ncbi:MAG: hypothetical protein AAF556_08555, partial [Pseudomonadota bacterium]